MFRILFSRSPARKDGSHGSLFFIYNYPFFWALHRIALKFLLFYSAMFAGFAYILQELAQKYPPIRSTRLLYLQYAH